MARAKFTLDEAAMLLVQLEAEDAVSASQLRDRIRRLSRSRALSAPARAEMQRAADALGIVARGEPEAGAALAAAGRHMEVAMRAAEEPTHEERAFAVTAVSPSDGEVPVASPAAEAYGIDPLMLASLAALDMLESHAASAEPVDPVAPAASAALPEAKPAEPPKWSADADVELLESFVAESTDYLQSAETALLLLEADPTSMEAVNTVFRCFHTIKGTSAFLGLERVSEVAHHAESLMSRVREREIRHEGRYADLALRSVDVLAGLVSAVTSALEGRPVAEPADCAPLIAALADPDAAVSPGPSPTRPAEEPAADRAGEAVAAGHGPNADAWMRVRTDRLDLLVDTIGELVIAHAMIAQDGVIEQAGDDVLSRKVSHASKIVRELQDLSIAMRMIPLKGVMQKLARVVRDAALKSGKQIELVVEGEDTEIDRNTVDEISDPLVHMIRNAVDHGIEAPADRLAAGKPAAGTIRISAIQGGGTVLITLSDDGRGLNRARIVDKAIARGLIESERALTDRDVFELIFAPGFSTAEIVTDLSGRGVGMDVVRRSVEALRGRVDIDSVKGRGTTFSIRLPLTLAITDGMLVRVGAERYIVPTMNIQLSFRPDRDMLYTAAGRGEMVRLRDEILPIVRLSRVLGIGGAQTDPTLALLMVVGSGERRCALLVDELLGQQQVVAKSLGVGFGRVPGISGGAILGDGRVGLILDLAEIMGLARQSGTEPRAA
jgi:two-component system chemotaxis sensor kinase CheA